MKTYYGALLSFFENSSTIFFFFNCFNFLIDLMSLLFFKGLILLTSDGRVPNAVLRGINKQPKVYKVEVDIPIEDRDIQRLRVSVFRRCGKNISLCYTTLVISNCLFWRLPQNCLKLNI